MDEDEVKSFCNEKTHRFIIFSFYNYVALNIYIYLEDCLNKNMYSQFVFHYNI